MKKLTALLLSVAMVISLCACGSQTADTASSAAPAATEEAAATETAAADEAPAADAAGVTVKAGFICLHDENSTYDLNFINGAKAACEALGIEYVIKTNIPEGQECYEAALDLADAGCNFIFADSFGHEDYMIQAAMELPEVQFSHATGTKAHTENLANFHNAFASIYEGRYLAGIVAGMKLNEMIDAGEITADQAKMGYVGAFTYAEVISGYSSFYLGAKSVCPTVTMDVTFTGSWYDETAGVPDVSYNGSTASACPNTFLVSSRIDWAPYFEYCIKCIQNGEAIATDYTGTLETGSVVLTDLGENVAAGTAEAIEAAKADIISGKTHVFDIETFTVDGAKLESYMADVDTDPEYAGDHEVIVDGYFNESGDGLRSAPYFNVNVDGISLLDTAF